MGHEAEHTMNFDGYMNMLTKMGIWKDSHEHYVYKPDMPTPDMELAQIYGSNGLFATIINNPAELALKNGFDLGISDPEIEDYVTKELARLHWSPKAVTAAKWARLFGGGAIFINADDGCYLDEPLNLSTVNRIDNLVVFERPEIQPDYTTLYSYVPDLRMMDRLGTPEYYLISPIYGGTQVRVHESRLMIFRNGEMPRTGVRDSDYMFFGIPEYNRIKRELRDTATTHGNGYRLLERCVQAVLKMNNLSSLLATADGEDGVIKRIQLIDMCRSFINTMVIDADGEDYSFQTFTLSGAKEIIDESCNMLSAVTHIPQTVLFGRSPAGMNATGESDLANYYDFVGQIQNPNIVDNLHRLVDVILMAGLHGGKISSFPDHEITPKPLWNLTEKEQAELDQSKAQASYVKAQTAQVYMESNVMDPSEVRKALAKEGDFDIEDVIPDDGDDLNIPEDTFGEKAALGQPVEITETGEDAAEEIEIEMPGEGKIGSDDKMTVPETGKEIDRIEITNMDGGPGSGDWGHVGRPGKVGGSGGGDGKGESTSGIQSIHGKQSVINILKSSNLFDDYDATSEGSVNARVYSALGIGGKPKVVAELDPLKPTVIRGIGDGGKTAEEYFDQLKDGNLYAKESTSGTGINFAKTGDRKSDERLAAAMAGNKGVIVEAQFDSTMKLVKFLELQKMTEEFAKSGLKQELLQNAKEQAKRHKKLAFSEGSEKEYNIGMAYSELATRIENNEKGLVAVLNGYDGCESDTWNEYCIFNRSKLIVKEQATKIGGSNNHDGADIHYGCGVIIVKEGKILCAKREDDGTICGPGGHLEEGETPEQATVREAQEEFSITPLNLLPLGAYEASQGRYCNSKLYFTDTYTGEPATDEDEMHNARWMTLDELRDEKLFPPFAESLEQFEALMKNYLTTSNSTDTLTSEGNEDGGTGSGNFGHGGRPGKVGGSSGGGSGAKHLSSKDRIKYEKALVGKTTGDGIKITGISKHADQRLAERRIGTSSLTETIAQKGIDGKHPGTKQYDKDGVRVIVGSNDGNVISAMWTGKGKPKGGSNEGSGKGTG